MYRVALVLALLTLVVPVALTSCAKQPEQEVDVIPGPEPMEAAPAMEPPAEPAAEPAAEGAESAEEGAEPAAEMDADAVVAEVGAPVFEGAEAGSVVMEDGATVAVFTTPASYDDVKEFYLGELKEPDWTNNGFEMGAMGGDVWEWKTEDETKLVTVERDSGESVTTLKFTLKPAEE